MKISFLAVICYNSPMAKDKKLSTDPYKGVRDFYPEDMAVQEYIFNTWKKTAESFGYEQYGASVLEPADIYKAKSGEEIVNEQTYTFIDRGEREVTLRPEMTPTVARMVAARKRELGLPLRWYSIPNLFRYEQPQRGRVREHWQLNVDLFGIDSVEADAEIISLAYQVMKNFGAKDGDFQIRINDRKLLGKEIEKRVANKDHYSEAIRLLDKRSKISTEEFNKKWATLSSQPLEGNIVQENDYVNKVMEKLSVIGIKNTFFDAFMARGFDYYTGMVFEIFDTNPENRRSLFGGGRYDDLTSLFGGDKVPAVGFGMGDVTIRDFLETHKLLPTLKSATEIHICTLDERFIPNAKALATKLRAKGTAVSVNLTAKKVGDQIGWADKHRIPKVIVVGEEEAKTGKFKIKTLTTGKEADLV
jgi:histidyl-tRNA synthetase